MGTSESILSKSSTSNRPSQGLDGIDTVGYRVLGVQPNSPASSANLVSFLDFIVGANGSLLFGVDEDEDNNTCKNLVEEEYYKDVDFTALIEDNIGRSVELLVWNIKSQTQRVERLIPSTNWGGAGLIGVTIRMDNYANADQRLLRILSIVCFQDSQSDPSPAERAGLHPLDDYLLGTKSMSFDNEDILAYILQRHENQWLEIYVYNVTSDEVRILNLMPTTNWGNGKLGLLGAEVGKGYLHSFPSKSRGTIGYSKEREVEIRSIKGGSSIALSDTLENVELKKQNVHIKKQEETSSCNRVTSFNSTILQQLKIATNTVNICNENSKILMTPLSLLPTNKVVDRIPKLGTSISSFECTSSYSKPIPSALSSSTTSLYGVKEGKEIPRNPSIPPLE